MAYNEIGTYTERVAMANAKAVTFTRQNPGPLDVSEVFASEAELSTYLAGANAFAGQVVAVVDNTTFEVTIYKIVFTEDGTALTKEEIGAGKLPEDYEAKTDAGMPGAGDTIIEAIEKLAGNIQAAQEGSVTSIGGLNGVIGLETESTTVGTINFTADSDTKKISATLVGEFEDGAQVNIIEKIKVGDTELPISDKTISLGTAASYDATEFETAGAADALKSYVFSYVYTKDETYNKTEIDGKLTGAFHYKGSKDTYAELPTEGNEQGDVWNIKTADTTHGISAGDNVAWDGEEWDVMSGTVDLSSYYTASEVDNEISTAVEAAKDELQGDIPDGGTIKTIQEAYALAYEAKEGAGVTSFAGKTGEIEIAATSATDGAVNLSIDNDNVLSASIVGLKTAAFEDISYFDDKIATAKAEAYAKIADAVELAAEEYATLEDKVDAYGGRIETLETAVGDSSYGLVHDVEQLQSSVGDTSVADQISDAKAEIYDAIDNASYVKAETLEGYYTKDDIDSTLESYVVKETGKGLSTNDFTAEYKTKLDGIAEGAEVNVQADWAITDSTLDSYIANKPANLVEDAEYKHITVTSTYVSDGTTIYKHAEDKAAFDAGAYKIGSDNQGHVINGGALTAADVNAYTKIETENKINDAVVSIQNLLDNSYVKAEPGKGLSTNDFTTAYMTKLDAVEAGAQVNAIETIKVNNTEVAINDKTVNIEIPSQSVYSIVKLNSAETGFAASYKLAVDGLAGGTAINIPKDYLVKSGDIKTCETADDPVEGYKVGDKYLDFVVNSTDATGNEDHIYILVSELVDAYTAEGPLNIDDTNKITILVDQTNGVASASRMDAAEGNITSLQNLVGDDTKGLISYVNDLQDRIDDAESSITALQNLVGEESVSETVSSYINDLNATVTAYDKSTEGYSYFTVTEAAGKLTAGELYIAYISYEDVNTICQ